MSAFLASQMASADGDLGADAAADQSLPAQLSVPAAAAAAVHVSGLAQRLPGDLASLEHAQDAVTAVPLERWDAAAGEATAAFGSFLAGVALFDTAAFSLSGLEATLVDPQQRMLLEAGR
jgi:acyl transferase domain-containing protein